MIRDSRNGDRNLFVTDRDLDPLVKELADLNGYHLLSGRYRQASPILKPGLPRRGLHVFLP
jgi:hypothetical protein